MSDKYLYISAIVLARWADGKGVTQHSRNGGKRANPKNWSKPHETATRWIREMIENAESHGETVLSSSHSIYAIEEK
jgi:hypothetical protein